MYGSRVSVSATRAVRSYAHPSRVPFRGRRVASPATSASAEIFCDSESCGKSSRLWFECVFHVRVVASPRSEGASPVKSWSGRWGPTGGRIRPSRTHRPEPNGCSRGGDEGPLKTDCGRSWGKWPVFAFDP